jgi:hypothetical protein
MVDKAPLIFTSDFEKFMTIVMDGDPAARAQALGKNGKDHILCELIRNGAVFEISTAKRASTLYKEIVVSEYSAEDRWELFLQVKKVVDNLESVGVNALLPFILKEPLRGIVSSAVIDYVAIGSIVNDDPLGRPKDIVEFIRSGNMANIGAAFGGLLHFGDQRVCRLIWPLRDLLEPDDVQEAIWCTTGYIYSSTVEFEIDWLEGLDGTIDDAVFSNVAAGLVREVRNSEMNVVLTGPRPFPIPKGPLTEAEQVKAGEIADPVPLEEFANRIAARLHAIERTEPPPRVMPHVLTAWGLEPMTDLSEALPLDDRVTPSTSMRIDTGHPHDGLRAIKEEWFDGHGHIFLSWGILNPNGPTLYCLGEREIEGQRRFFFRWLHMLGGVTYFGRTLQEGEISYQAIFEAASDFAYRLGIQGEKTPFDVIPSFVIPNNGDATIAKIAATLISSDAPHMKDWGREVAYLDAFGADYFSRAGCEIRVAYEQMKAKPAHSAADRDYLFFIKARYGHIPAFSEAIAPTFASSGYTQELFDRWWRVVNTSLHMVSGLESLVEMWRGAQSILSDDLKSNATSIEAVLGFLTSYGFELPEEASGDAT